MEKVDLVLDTLYKSGRIILVHGNEYLYETNLQDKRVKSDNLLDEIKSALKVNAVQLTDIKRLTLIESNVGITKNRVFKSIALGIKDSLNIELRTFNSLDIFKIPVNTKFDYIFAYESDNEQVNWLEFTRKGNFEGNQFLGRISEFSKVIQNAENFTIYVTDTLLSDLKNTHFNQNLLQFNLDKKIKTRLIM